MNRQLSEYNQKRNFGRTTEPEGITVNSEEQLRFVVQHHIASKDHFDFRLEWNGTLLSWAVPKGPSFNPKEKRLAIKVEDHPMDDRNFEATLPKGDYGGGVVMLWDEGFWVPCGNVDQGLDEGVLKFKINGIRLKGKWALIRLKGKASESKDNWLLLKEKDEYIKTETGISEFLTSIRTGRTMTEIEEGKDESFTRNPFDSAKVQLAKLVKKVPEGDDWLYEMKYDGYRILAFVEGNNARLITRNNNDYTKRFYSVANALAGFSKGKAMVLDGEMTIIDKAGKTDFQALQNYMKNPKNLNLTYIVFDLLALDGEDLRQRPLFKRKELLENLMKDAPENLYYSRHVKGNGKDSFVVACETGMEGIVGKKYDSVYNGTRSGDWIKLKCDKRQEFVIGGHTRSDKKISGISSLLLGIYEDENLIFSGRAGTGFNKHNTKELTTKFNSLIRKKAPFKNPPKVRSNEEITWLEPELAAEIKFAEWTEDNQLRQASFKGLREDKNPKDIKKESVAEESEKSMESNENNSNIIIDGIKVTSPDKVIFEDPEITKIDVIRYYEKVSEKMLTFVGHRILSIVRCPKGVNQTCFYKKHPGSKLKGIATLPISKDSEDSEEYFYIENKSGLISEAQMGTLEFHTWGSRVDNLEKPDMMVFDLDPDEGMDLEQVRQGARDLREILNELSLDSYIKTSGGKGYHVVVPLKPTATWDTFYTFAKSVAEVMEKKWSDRYTTNSRKTKRSGKIFIDWMRNGRGATSVAPYSLRAREGAAVSMPITWEELDSIAPDGVNMHLALQRILTDDPWEGFFSSDSYLA